MPNKYLMIAVSAALVAGLSACESPKPASASRPVNVQTVGSVDNQQREVEGRIEAAFRAGRINADQHRGFRAQADDIRKDERRAAANGVVSAGERQALLNRLENLSRDLDRVSTR